MTSVAMGAVRAESLLLTLFFNPLIANFTKWSNTLKQFVGNLTTNCLRVFDHSVGLALKGLKLILFPNITVLLWSLIKQTTLSIILNILNSF